MPRDLGDVLHYFFHEEEGSTPAAPRADGPGLRVVAVPLGERDVVRATLLWNLAVEMARRGASASVVAPAGGETEALWPEPGRGPLGVELVLAFARDLAELARSALDVATTAGAASRQGLVLVRVPPAWLTKAGDAPDLFDWTLLFASPDSQDRDELLSVVKGLAEARPTRIGVTIHGPSSIQEAREAFDRLDESCTERLGLPLTSYGLLVDDVHVYRAIVNRRPVGLSHPQGVATRALRDVARLLLLDAGGSEDG